MKGPYYLGGYHDQIPLQLTIRRWWFPIFFDFPSKIGEDSHFDSYFSKGLVQPPTRLADSQVAL